MLRKYTNKMYCFSPPVMVATFALEIALAAYTIWRYKLQPVSRLVVAILFFLAGFQLAEYMVCEGALGVDAMTWARLGYMEITILPILGLHLAMVLARKRMPILLGLGYASAAAFMFFFMVVEQAITGHQCLGNYVIFSTAPGSEKLYTVYYYGWLLVVMYLAFRWSTFEEVVKVKRALYALTTGYALFVLPTTAVNILDPATIIGIPSIMCGFAVLLALILVGWVLPVVNKKR